MARYLLLQRVSGRSKSIKFASALIMALSLFFTLQMQNAYAQLPNGFGGDNLANTIFIFLPQKSPSNVKDSAMTTSIPNCQVNIKLELKTYPESTGYRLMRLNSTGVSAVGALNFQVSSFSLADSRAADLSDVTKVSYSLYNSAQRTNVNLINPVWILLHPESAITMLKPSLAKVTLYPLKKLMIIQVRNCKK